MLSPSTTWVGVAAMACEKVASDLGLSSGSHWLLRFTPPLNLASHDLV